MGTLQDGKGFLQQSPNIDYATLQRQLAEVLGKTPIKPKKGKRLPKPVEQVKMPWWKLF